jgi:class 3 adenylate cyclase/predicted ATPase
VLARKTVTILFCDVADSTPLGERLDPESLQRMMSRWFDEAKAVIEHHGGTVEKFIGDEVMAVFGVPLIHEDDALRALRAAAEMRDRLDALNQQFEADFGLRVAVRMGINTGEVVAGDPASGATFVTGEAVNLAKRLEQAAQAGEILIGKETYPLVRDAVRAGPLKSFSVKGKREPVATHRVHGVDAHAAAIARRLDTPLVDRERELRFLREIYQRAVQERTCQLLTILGPAGNGKSRLAGELLSSLGDHATALAGRCLPYGDGITFWPLVEIVREAVGDGELEELLLGTEDAAAIADGVRGAIGLSALGGTNQETFWAVRRLIETIAEERPLILCFEDIHWAEPTLLDLIEYLAGWSHHAPLLILCLARPDLLESRPSWATPSPGAHLLTLEQLSETDSGTLMELLAGSAELSQRARLQIVEAAEGNPLFVEQMVAHLAEQEDADANFAVPGSIQALLAERLDRLSDEERVVIERASVVGRDFPRGAVDDLCAADERDALASHLLGLVRKGLIQPSRSRFAREDGFRFRHALIRDAAYQAMSKEVRAELHARHADWLEVHAADFSELEEVLGYHFEQAFQYRDQLGLVDQRERILAMRGGRHLSSAGRRAFARGDAPGAAKLLTRATLLLRDEEGESLELAPELGEALARVGELEQSEGVLTHAVGAAAERGHSVLEARARVALGELRLLKDRDGKLADAQRDAENALTTFAQAGDEVGLAWAWHLLAECRSLQSQFGDAERLLQEALKHADQAGDARKRGSILIGLAYARYLGPTPVAEAIKQTRPIFEPARGNLVVQAQAAALLAGLEAMRRRFGDARQLCARSRALFEALGEKFWLAGAQYYFASVEFLAGDAAAAERELSAAFGVFAQLGLSSDLATAAAELAEVEYAQGRFDEAERHVELSRDASSRDDVFCQVMWRRTAARLLLDRKRFDEAAELSQEAVTVVAATDCLNLHADALVVRAEIERVTGARDAAAGTLDQAVRLYEAKGNLASREHAQRAFGELGSVSPAATAGT